MSEPTGENSGQPADIPVFGARKKAKELAAEVATLRAELDRLGAMSMLELEQRREALASEIADETTRLEAEKVTAAKELERQAAEAKQELETQIATASEEKRELDGRLLELRQQVVVTEETALLQEAGVYEYSHPLDDAVEYQDALKSLRSEYKAMTKKDGGAIVASTNWEVEGSLPKGRKMVRDFSKLMLRAYNAEADNLVRGLKPYNCRRRSSDSTKSRRRSPNSAR